MKIRAKNKPDKPSSAPSAQRQSHLAVLLILLFSGLTAAAGLLVPGLLLRRQAARLRAASGVVEASGIVPYSHRTQPQRVAAIRSADVSAEWSEAREPFENELSAAGADTQARWLMTALCIELDNSGVWFPDSLLSALFDSGDEWSWSAVRFLSAADDPTLSAWVFELGQAQLTLDAVSGAPVKVTLPLLQSAELPLYGWWAVRSVYQDACPSLGIRSDTEPGTGEYDDESGQYHYVISGKVSDDYTLELSFLAQNHESSWSALRLEIFLGA